MKKSYTEHQYEEARANLRDWYGPINNRPFRYLTIQYPPFSEVNGESNGVFVRLVKAITADLGIESEGIHCTWKDHEQKLREEAYATMTGPVFPRSWGRHEIVGFVCFWTGFLVFERRIGLGPIEKRLQNIHATCAEFKRSLDPSPDYFDDVLDMLEDQLRGIRFGDRGLAVAEFFAEDRLLDLFGLSGDEVVRFTEPDPLMSLQKATQDGYFYVTDSVVLGRLVRETKDFEKKYCIYPLFGHHVPIPAGLPVTGQRRLRIYLAYALRDIKHPVRRVIDEWVDSDPYWRDQGAIGIFPEAASTMHASNFFNARYILETPLIDATKSESQDTFLVGLRQATRRAGIEDWLREKDIPGPRLLPSPDEDSDSRSEGRKGEYSEIVVSLAGWIQNEKERHFETIVWDEQRKIPEEERMLIPKRMFQDFDTCVTGTCFRYRIAWLGRYLVTTLTPVADDDLYKARVWTESQRIVLKKLRKRLDSEPEDE